MHTASYEFLIKPKESAGCHQTLSMWVGSEDETNSAVTYQLSGMNSCALCACLPYPASEWMQSAAMQPLWAATTTECSIHGLCLAFSWLYLPSVSLALTHAACQVLNDILQTPKTSSFVPIYKQFSNKATNSKWSSNGQSYSQQRHWFWHIQWILQVWRALFRGNKVSSQEHFLQKTVVAVGVK